MDNSELKYSANNLKQFSGIEVGDFSIPSEYDKISRLIIIGNGFDIAHGLASRFGDFIIAYCEEVVGALQTRSNFEDPLLSITIVRDFLGSQTRSAPLKGEAAVEYLISPKSNPFRKVQWKSKFFNSLLFDFTEKKWVDIEVAYFAALKIAFQASKKGVVEQLNDELIYIREKFKGYLSSRLKMLNPVVDPQIKRQFSEKILVSNCEPNTTEFELVPQSFCMLNFNYTDIAERYFTELFQFNGFYVPIHGQLDGDDVSKQGPIFGFGDELDRDYAEFEHQSNDEVFKHIKSFKYLQFSHYRKLLVFINAGPFQVQLFGHSCGLSDRTLLNTIFENENCISIKLFYHQRQNGNDYEEKTFAISRHFTSKAALRSKVVNKEFCQPMAQPYEAV